MKNRIILIVGFLLFAVSTYAQKSKKVQEVTIESSIQCGMCEDRLNDMFAEFWAVKAVDYDLDKQTITVQYNAKKTNEDEIRLKIAETGYDADELVAKQEAYDALPACCQKGGHHP
ncbi:MAG: heavy-metal-associated domain-containing protein [Saprospiraceae bacterium]|nr:heavy-metal-associated domain-containing protein [Saprospiraceae bacterium]